MGMCYSLSRRLCADNNASISDQPPDCHVPLSSGGDTREECEDSVSTRKCLFCRGNTRKHPNTREIGHRLIQDGNSAEHSRYSDISMQKHTTPKRTNLEKVKAEKAAVKAAKKISKNIDRAIKEQRRDYQQIQRLLLLGDFPEAPVISNI